MSASWKCVQFSELNGFEVYELLLLREQVFILEQECLYSDIDGIDLHAYHVLGMSSDRLIGYARIYQGDSPGTIKIGRIVVPQSDRALGLGKELVSTAIAFAQEIYSPESIHISAQSYLLNFYKSFGFSEVGESYMLDGIPHNNMILLPV